MGSCFSPGIYACILIRHNNIMKPIKKAAQSFPPPLINLFIVFLGCAGFQSCVRASLVMVSGGLSRLRSLAWPPCSRLPGRAAERRVESSQTRDGTHVPWVRRWTLNRWTTRKSQVLFSSHFSNQQPEDVF